MQRSLLLQLVAVNQRMGALVERELLRDSVRSEGYALLSTIGAFGPLSVSDAASALGLPLTTASDAVGRLVAARLVRRTRSPVDGRSRLLELTERGDAEWRKGWPALRRTNGAIARHLPVSPDEAKELLEQLDAALAKALAD